MGPSPLRDFDERNTITNTKPFLYCLNSCFKKQRNQYRHVKILKDGRIICFEMISKVIKIYQLVNTKLQLCTTFTFTHEERPMNLLEIEGNIILLDLSAKLVLINLISFKILQTIIPIKESIQRQIIKLPNGLIVVNDLDNFIFYKYDKRNKKLEKVDEYKSEKIIGKIMTINNENFFTFFGIHTLVNYNLKTSREIKLKKTYEGKRSYNCNVIDNYLFVSYFFYEMPQEIDDNEVLELNNCYFDIYEIDFKNLKYIFKQTINVKHPFFIDRIKKLNDKILIGRDDVGNIIEFNFDEKSFIVKKNVFKAHNFYITCFNKYDDNKILSTSFDGNVKLWEFK
jgi:hypothetical protein